MLRTLCCGIHGAGLPPFYVLHQFAVVVVCRAGGELKGREASAAQSLHGSVHAVDKVEVLKGCVNALVGCASGVSLPACDNMEAHGNVGLSLPSRELAHLVLLELNKDGRERPRYGGGDFDNVFVLQVYELNVGATLGDMLGDSLKNLFSHFRCLLLMNCASDRLNC